MQAVNENGHGSEVDQLSTRVRGDAPPQLAEEQAWANDRYVPVGRLGEGGMGVVYRAFDTYLNRAVALKVVRRSKECSDRLMAKLHAMSMHEAQSLARIAHPNVVAVYDVGGREDDFFMAMELVEGVSLDVWLAERSAHANWRDIAQLMLAAARGLSAAHRRGLVHRDIKPQNLLIGEDGLLRVVDFGLAVEHDSAVVNTLNAGVSALSRSNQPDATDERNSIDVCGTPIYMSPEQHLGAPVDQRADQFCLCATFYEAFTGVQPFVGDSVDDLADAKRDGVISRGPATGTPMPGMLGMAGRSSMPNWLRRILVRGMAWHPEDRHADLDVLIATIERGLSRGRRTLAVMAGVCIVAALVVPTYAAVSRDDCRHGDDQMAQIWSPARHRAISAALVASVDDMDAHTVGRVLSRMDDFAETWRAGYRSTCERGLDEVISARESDTRTECLSEGRSRFDALATLLTQANANIATNALKAVGDLPDPEDCNERSAAELSTGMFPDASTAAAISALQGAVARVRALDNTGEYEKALEEIVALTKAATKIDHPPFTAELWLLRGTIERSAERADAASKSFFHAVQAALRGRRWDVAAEAATARVYVVGYLQARLVGIDELIRDARSYVRRAGSPPRLRGLQLASEAAVRAVQGRNAETYELMREAHAIAEAGDPFDPGNIMMVQDLGAITMSRNELDEAERLFNIAVERQEQAFGRGHPNTARTLANLGTLYLRRGRPHVALDYYRRGQQMIEAYLGAGSPRANLTYQGQVWALNALGRYAEALELLQARELVAVGHPDSVLGTADIPLSMVLLYAQLGDEDAARRKWSRVRKAIERFGEQRPAVLARLPYVNANLDALFGDYTAARELYRPQPWPSDDAPEPAVVLALVDHNGMAAEVLLASGQFEAAQQIASETLVHASALLGPDNLNHWQILATRAEALVRLQRYGEALADLERAELLVREYVGHQSHLLVRIYELRGELEATRGHTAAAARAYRRALELFDPEQADPDKGRELRQRLRAQARMHSP